MAGNNENWLEQIPDELGDLDIEFPSHTIFKVPHALFNKKSEISYRPAIVSIGPFHHGAPELQSMEEHKRRYLLSLMRRTTNPQQVLASCSNRLLALDESIRACYAENIQMSENQLAYILLHDGCFLIELFLRNSSQESEEVIGDPLFDTGWMIATLRRDLALLENQIPFCVLQELFKWTVRSRYRDQLVALKTFILQLFRWELNLEDEGTFDEKCHDPVTPDHLLDLIRRCYVPSIRVQPNSVPNQHDWKFIRSAKELSEVGVGFGRKNSTILIDVLFKKELGIFEIPQLAIHAWTEPLFRNLMAFEQSRYNCPRYITSYIFLMDRLIDTASDVIFLEKKEILKGYMGDAEAVASLFNNLTKQIVLMEFHFGDLCNEVDKYCTKSCPKYKATFKREYCSDPWRIAALVFAGLILFFAALQAIYSLVSYHHPRRS